MYITQEDVMKFVFFNESLDEDIKKYIQSHIEDYAEQIHLCKQLKAPLSEEDNKVFSEMIVTRFPATVKSFVLYPKTDRILPRKEVLTLAAASEVQNRIETLSFTDNESQVIVRIIKENDEQRLYLFPLIESGSTYKIILYPSEEIVIINNLQASYKITSDTITKIIVHVTG